MKRITVTFLGRNLGTASGWDGDSGEVWWVYDFEPNPEIALSLSACKCLQLDETSGQIHEQDDEGNNLNSFTIEWILVKLNV